VGWTHGATQAAVARSTVIGLLRRLLSRTRVEKESMQAREDAAVARYAQEVDRVYRDLPKDPPPEIYREIERAEQVLKRDRRGT
jgi:hypothetical protein